jgi:hypothetical protein
MHVGPFGLDNGAFDNDVVNLPVIVLMLPLGIKISVGASGDCQDCAMCGESINLLWRFLDLWWRLGGGLGSILIWGLALFAIGYVMCGTGGGYVICGTGKG